MCPSVISYILNFKYTQRKDKPKHTYKYQCHWQSLQTNYSKWITQKHLLNSDSIPYEHNLLLITNLTQHTKQQAIKKILKFKNPTILRQKKCMT